MVNFRKIFELIERLFIDYFPVPLTFAISMIATYLHMLGRTNTSINEGVTWSRFWAYYFSELSNILIVSIVFILLILAFSTSHLVLATVRTNETIWPEAQHELKHECTKLLFIKLVADTDRAECRYLRRSGDTKEPSEQNIVNAHKLIYDSVILFRRTVQRIWDPASPELVYTNRKLNEMIKKLHRELHHSRFYIFLNDLNVDEIMHLLN